jgi:hypothetical protein
MARAREESEALAAARVEHATTTARLTQYVSSYAASVDSTARQGINSRPEPSSSQS